MPSLRWVCASILALSVVGGCSRGEGSTVAAPPKENVATKAEPQADLHEKLRAGAYQYDAALNSLEEARTAIRSILPDQGGDTKEALLDLIDALDSSGETLGEYNAAPEVAEVQRDPAAAEKRRTQAIEDGNDARREIADAQGTLSAMLESEPPAKERAALDKANDSVAEALDAIADGIRLLGGTIVEEKSEADAGTR